MISRPLFCSRLSSSSEWMHLGTQFELNLPGSCCAGSVLLNWASFNILLPIHWRFSQMSSCQVNCLVNSVYFELSSLLHILNPPVPNQKVIERKWHRCLIVWRMNELPNCSIPLLTAFCLSAKYDISLAQDRFWHRAETSALCIIPKTVCVIISYVFFKNQKIFLFRLQCSRKSYFGMINTQ